MTNAIAPSRANLEAWQASAALAAAVLGFFVVTLDAVIVNVALPSVRDDLGGGMAGLQWVVDGYTLLFAGLLLSTGALSDRLGADRALALGLAGFAAASAACGMASSLTALVVARMVQGSFAALIMPSSMALVGRAYPDPTARARAVGVWAMGGTVASCCGPLLGGALTPVSWRLIFAINLPVATAGLVLIARVPRSPRRVAQFDWVGQSTAILAVGALTYGAIEASARSFTDPRVGLSVGLALVAGLAFLRSQAHGAAPVVPLHLFRIRHVSIAIAVGFAFVVAYYGLPFVMSLYLQQHRRLSALATGLAFAPMMLVGLVLTPLSARITDRAGVRATVCGGLGAMTVGLLCLAALPDATPTVTLAAAMVLVGIGGPLVMPPITSALLNSVPANRAGTVSGVFNAGRQVGGALAVAVFGALMASPTTLHQGMRLSVLTAAVVVLGAASAAARLHVPSTD